MRQAAAANEYASVVRLAAAKLATARPARPASKYDFVKVKVWLGEQDDHHYYVLSRFLISRTLTMIKVPQAQAVRIALDLKKYLVDAERFDIAQAQLEAILFRLMTAAGYGDEYVRRYVTLTAFYHQRRSLLVLMTGSPCCGKSTLAQKLAARLNLPNVLQTDIIYELLHSGKDAPLAAAPLWERPELRGAPARLVAEYCREAAVVRRGLQADIAKAIRDGKSMVMEGLHLDPGLYLQQFSASRAAAPAGAPALRSSAALADRGTHHAASPGIGSDCTGPTGRSAAAGRADATPTWGRHPGDAVCNAPGASSSAAAAGGDSDGRGCSGAACSLEPGVALRRGAAAGGGGGGGVEPAGGSRGRRGPAGDGSGEVAGACATPLAAVPGSLSPPPPASPVGTCAGTAAIPAVAPPPACSAPLRSPPPAARRGLVTPSRAVTAPRALVPGSPRRDGGGAAQGGALPPLFVPMVVSMEQEDQRMLLQAWFARRQAAAAVLSRTTPDAVPAGEAQDVVGGLEQLQLLGDYLSSYERCGVPIFRVSTGSFGEVLDDMHDHLLACIEHVMHAELPAYVPG